ncbi:hypothetical protein JKX24_22775 [Serratia proteamaculans]|uniref:Uncharacterized protein n=1 Tax=Serratia proteamaculans TaxID=28151 RepID=A0A7U0N5K3_SERPR|nr:hypothetical protein [Serratia proteamaculans]MBO1501770.1 hypothetical protein [Serratia proteamaculans]MDW5508619.1 hypothetical protein [Serratia proteamaculans]QQX52956.1 hypothetical protein JKX24_22775 [Serratia proteamaculans]
MKQERLKRLKLVAGVSFTVYLITHIREFHFPGSLFNACLASIIVTLLYAFLSSHFWKKYVLKLKDVE